MELEPLIIRRHMPSNDRNKAPSNAASHLRSSALHYYGNVKDQRVSS